MADGERQDAATGEQPKKIPRGVVLGKDGKPCRSCTSFAAWAAQTKQKTTGQDGGGGQGGGGAMTASSLTAAAPRPDCPPDVEALGRSTWTLLHSIAASYPEAPSRAQQSDLLGFVGLFGRLYPCWVCADDFQAYMARRAPPVASRREFGDWLCAAHNDVNRRLGKPEFDCATWEQRWRSGWKDGRCD
ncbi:Erv1 / Alr family protein [Hirsutella rhossiliensis]|uniref:Sulfhydryl oxidase n=1 Tax=Hirsutella rhossiliensis TaxID=111463 RepID=A0A9P8MME0_9HYPO|nr:erv1 / alr family domain-containing protein [Hirsutella rhossiliensis]KAH0957977.1 erv1 / alr family domain-containing protein [Hirsutella rhossiliensis]